MATMPVLTISSTPYGRSTSSSPSILSSPPVISMVNESGATSTTLARNTLANSSTCERASCVAATLIMARSRTIEGSFVMFSTSRTFTSLYRFASMRRAWSWSASTVIVMRETSGFSVRPTVSESILNARRRNSDATRVSTPGLFSTYTTYVFSMFSLFVRRRLHNLAGPPDHLVQRRTRRHHRIHRILLLDAKINQHGTIVLTRRPHRRHHLRSLGYRHAANSISFAEFCEVWIQQRRGRIVPLVEKLLPLPHHAEETVVDDRTVHIQFLLHNRRQFAQRRLEAASAHRHPDCCLGPGHLRANRRRQCEHQRPQPAGRDQTSRLLVLVVLRFPHLVLAHVGHDYSFSVARLAPQVVDDVRRIKMPTVRQVLYIAHRRITLQFVDEIEPFAAVNRFHMRQQLVQHLSQIPDQRHIHFDVLIDLGRIDLDMNLLRVRRVRLQVARDAIVKSHSERQQQVCFLNRVIHPRFAVHTHHAQVQWMSGGKRADSQQSERHRNARLLGKLAHFGHGSRNDDPVSRQNHGALGIVDQLQSLLILLLIR